MMGLTSVVRTVLLVLIFFLLSGGYLITMIPAGPSYQVHADVVSRTSRSGATGNTGILICVLENGSRVTVEIPPIATVQTGDKVVLDSYNRYFISPKYNFAGKLISRE